MPRKLGAFTVPDCQRIKQVVRTVEGAPRNYLRVPERVPRHSGGGGGGNTSTITGGTAFSIAEYDATTGDLVRLWYRGLARSSGQGTGLGDIYLMYSSDGFLYSAGPSPTNRDTACVMKWNANTGEKVWDSDRNGLSAPTVAGPGQILPVNTVGKALIESDDGAIWVRDGLTIARIDPDTGVQSHSYTTTTSESDEMWPTGSSGAIIVVNDNTNSPGIAQRRLNSSASSTHTVANFGAGIAANALETVVTPGYVVWQRGNRSSIFVNSTTDLSSVSTYAPGGTGLFYGLATDGTNVFVGNTNYEARSITNLSSVTWTGGANPMAGLAHRLLLYERGFLYHFGESTNRVVRINPSNGSIVWNITTSQIGLASGWQVGVGSDFVVYGKGSLGSGFNIMCLNASDGSTRWTDYWNIVYSIVVTDDDRIFACGLRREV